MKTNKTEKETVAVKGKAKDEKKKETSSSSKGAKSEKAKKGRAASVKRGIVDAQVLLTEEELEHYEYWLSLARSLKWLNEEPEDEETKTLVRDFMALLAKIKMAVEQVEESGNTVCLGTSKATGNKLVLDGRLYGETAKDEADFVVSFFMAYLASKVGAKTVQSQDAKHNAEVTYLREMLKTAEDTIARKDLRIKDMEQALAKAEQGAKNFQWIQRDRMPSKRLIRLRASTRGSGRK